MSLSRLHVVICNERLLPRFGVDRLLMLLGAGLSQRGHRITFLCLRCDRPAVETITSDVRILTPGRHDIAGADADMASWFREHWEDLFDESPPDLLVTGGWPFFCVGQIGATFNVPSVFIDAGAVPHDGLPEGAVFAQRAVRRLRADAMPRFSAVLPISRFIKDGQTLPDRGTHAGVHTILLGADHLSTPLFAAPEVVEVDVMDLVEELTAEGHPLLLLLGRFEPDGYKNSPAAFDVLARVLEEEPKTKLLVLARPNELSVPPPLQHAVVPLGYVSDATLAGIMQRCALGLSVSLWEGFNLPLAEMQWYGRPVLAFNVGAHPEVSCDPWLLCCSPNEMARKAVRILRSGLPEHLVDGHQFDAFRERFRWNDVVARYAAVLEELTAAGERLSSIPTPPRSAVLIDCTSAAIDPANPGVMRVVRRLAHALQEQGELLVLFARWDVALNSYRPLVRHERETLATYDGPLDGVGQLFDEGGPQLSSMEDLLRTWGVGHSTMLFIPEVVLDGRLPERVVWARAHGLPIAAILYDLIPITHAPFCSADVVKRFPEYLEGLAAVDAIFAISAESLRQFSHYANRHALPHPPCAEVIWLPSQFGAQSRRLTPTASAQDGPLVVLCVGSIEPRKNHRMLIAAFLDLLEQHPDLPVQLVLAGHRFAGAEELGTWLEDICRAEPRIMWTGLVSDAQLTDLYSRAAFTVYPSLAEGFGLPVVESLWMARPVLCHNEGVMAELAASGGCLTVDMHDADAIRRALERLLCDADLRRRLSEEAVGRALLDWTGYAAVIGARLQAVCDGGGRHLATVEMPSTDQVVTRLVHRLREETETLRLLTDRFIQATDVSVFQ
jgi:glycosyltransferase involved in cell wall biosynthesis